MPVEKHPLILTKPSTPLLEDFISAISALPSDSDDAKLYTDVMKCISLGLLAPNKQQMEAIKLLFMKKVSDAPKDFNIRKDVSVEVVIMGFLEKNRESFGNILDMAKDITAKETSITESLET